MPNMKEINKKKLIKLENNGELKKILDGLELHNEAFHIIEQQLNKKAEDLISKSVNYAKKQKDKVIIGSHSRTAIEEFDKMNIDTTKRPLIEGIKIIGNLGLGICIMHLAYVSQNDKISFNLIIILIGIIGALLLGIGLYKR
jgi:hypothetical protein